MNYKKFAILPAVLLTLAGGAFLVTNSIGAQETGTPVTSIVQKIADRFGLNKDEVQQVFDEERDARKAEMEAAFEQKLTDAVSNGEISEEQKQLIIAKRSELEANMQGKMENFKSMTKEERQAHMDEMKAEHQALEDWANENGIDMKYLGFHIRVGKFDGAAHGMAKDVMFYKAQ